MAKAEMYRNRKGKRRVRLTLTGKEARWLYAVAYAEAGDGEKTPDWTVFDALTCVMGLAEPQRSQSKEPTSIPKVRWFDAEAQS